MYNLREDVAKIVSNGNIEDMKKLSDIFEDVICTLKDYDEEAFEKYATCIYTMANGYELNRTMAEKIVNSMKPIGQHWTIEQTTSVKNQYGYTNVSDIDFWVVMNSAYNDYRDLFKENIEMYARWSYAFINDEDAKEGKVFIYFTKIPDEN
jgi:hypothetical protein